MSQDLNFQITLDDTKAKAQAQAFSHELENLSETAAASGKEMDALLRSLASGFASTTTATTQSAAQIGAALKQLDTTLASLSDSVTTSGREITQTGRQTASSFRPAREFLQALGDQAEATAPQVESAFTRVGQTIVATFGTTALLGFARSILQVRADMQSLEASFTTLLGSGQRAQAMLSELTRFGAETPMDLSDLARASQTMLSFGVAGEKVVPLIKQLGDISGGSGDKLQNLALAFSQMSSTGRLMGQDLNQMINAGFNPLTEIARTTGRSMAELKASMEAGAISIDLVEGALKSATSEGGLFFGNLDAQSKTLRGQFGALSDAYEQMLNQIGQQSEGVLGKGIGFLTSAVEHWQTLAKVILATATAVGAYKTALLATVALDKARATATWIAEARSLETLIGAQGVALVQKEGLTIGTQAYTQALVRQYVAQQATLGITITESQAHALATAGKTAETTATGLLSSAKATLTAVTARLNAVLLANPYALAAAAVALLAYGIYELVTYESEAEASTRKLKDAHADAVKEYESEKLVLQGLYTALEEAKRASEDTTKSQEAHNQALSDYQQKKDELLQRAPASVSALVKERLEVNDLAGAYRLLTDEVRKSIMARHREQVTKDLGEQFFEKDKKRLERIYKQLVTAYGQEVGAQQYAQVRGAIESGQGLNIAFIRQLKQKLAEKGEWSSAIQNFNEDVYYLRISKEQLAQKVKKAQALFGDAQLPTATSKPLQGDVAEQTRRAKEAYDKARERIADLRTGAVKVKAGEEVKAIEEATKAMEEAAKKYETLTGQSLQPKAGKGRSGGGRKSDPATARLIEAKKLAIQARLEQDKEAQQDKETALRLQEERLNLMDEGWQKEEARLQLNASKRLQAYEKLQRELLERQRAEAERTWTADHPQAKDKGEVFDPTTVTTADLSESARAQLTELARIHREQELREQEAHARKLLEGIESYEQQRLRLTEDYARRRESLYQHDSEGARTGYRAGVTADNEGELNRKESQALDALNLEFAKRSEAFKAWLDSIASLSLEQLASALERAKAELEKLRADPAISGADLATASAKVERLQKSIATAKAKATTAPDKRGVKEWKDLSDTIDKSARSFNELGDAIGGTAGKLLKGIGTIATGTVSAINSVVQLTQASATAMNATAGASAQAMKTVEKASAILAIVTTALSVAQTIAQLFNSDGDRDKEIQALQARIDALQWEIDHASTRRMEQSVNSFQAVSEAIAQAEAQIGRFTWQIYASGQATDYFNRRTALAASQLARVYEQVAYSANKAVGAEKYQEARAQLKAMAEQQVALSQQMGAEGKKKKRDGGRIDEYKRKIAELGEKQVEIINKLTEDVFGGDFAKLATELGDAIASAFDRGEDAAEAFRTKVGDILRDLVRRQLTEQLLMKPMLDVFDKYKERFAEATFDPQKIIALTGSLSRDLKSVGDQVVPAYTAAMKTVQEQLAQSLGASESARQATKRGIATASQGSVDENNGLLRSIQGLTSEIRADLSGLRAVASEQLRHLARIDDHTAHLQAMSQDIRDLSRTLSDIQTRGVRIKD